METGISTCHWHPDQRAGVICQRCDRPICPRCMHQASVGFHCPDCSKLGAQKVIRGPAAVGALNAPIATKVLIAANVAVFVLGFLLLQGQTAGNVLFSGSARLIVDGGLVRDALSRGGELIGVANGEWWRIVTSGFLHAGILHLGFNMYALWWLGGEIERGIGRSQFLAIYAVSLLAGSLGAMLTTEAFRPVVGASGAIYGLMGALVASYRSRGIRIQDSPIFGVLILNFLLTLGISSISIGGHVGGFIGGLVAGWLLLDLGTRTRNPTLAYGLSAAVGLACVATTLAVAGT